MARLWRAGRNVGLRDAAALCAVIALGALPAACGTVLGLDSIRYDVVAEGGALAAADGGGTITGPDGAVVDAAAPGLDAFALDQSTADAGRPDGPFTVAHATGVPQALAVDDTRLYWVNVSGPMGSVQSVSKDGTGGIATIAANQPSPLDIAVDGTSLYWSVNQVPPQPGQTQCLAMIAGKDGGTPGCAATGAFASIRMILSGSYVLILSQAAANEFIGYATSDGGYTNVQAQGPALAVTSTAQSIFIGNKNGYHVDQLTLAALGFGPILCGDDCGNAPIVDMTVDVGGSNLLWITQAGGFFTESIASTGQVGTQLAQIATSPRRMARDASYVYVTVASSVLAIPISPLDAGPPTLTLASGEATPFGVAVDDAYVYWTDGDGTIRAVSVPAPP